MFAVVKAIFRPLGSIALNSKLYCSSWNKGSSTTTMTIRQNFHEEVEKGIQNQIKDELDAAYSYLSMAAVFGRDTVALPGFQHLFNDFAEGEVTHARLWIDYLNLRGGKAKFHSLDAVVDVDWTPLCAVVKAFETEMTMTKNILKLRELSEKHHDFHFSKFVEDDFLIDQYEDVKKLGDLKTQLERVQDQVGLYILDKNIFEELSKKNGK